MDVIFTISMYLLTMNIIGFFLMGYDKWKARKQAFRIPEATLFIVAVIGGSLGSILGMHLFHHKTRHWYFLYGMPAILAVQILLAVLLSHAPVEFGIM